MNSPTPFTLRIRTEQEQEIDWIVQPDEITFHQALEVISRITPDTTTTAFQYIDCDDEKITVRSDEELKAMFEMYFCDLSEEDTARGLLPPLVIYPRVGKTPKDRNIHDLKIKTAKTSKTQQNTQQRQTIQSNLQPNVSTNRSQPVAQQQAFGAQQQGYSVQQQSHRHGTQHTTQLHGAHHSPMDGVQQHGQMHGAGTQNTASQNIKEILTCGRIVETDLEQMSHIGNGNGGHVYKAFHVPSQRQMAVKVIQLDVDVEVQKKILSELEILYKCHSPAIIDFYGAFFIENRISLCTEFMDGGSLDKYGQIPEEIVGRMAVRIVQGLMYMWSQKILHRDIKPSNILVNTNGEVKLCDFGVSTQLVESIAMTYVGTNAYMAPERIKAENYGNPSEVWSLGVTLFEMATGHFPFQGKAQPTAYPGQLLSTILDGTTPVLLESSFSTELVDFVTKCMQKQPEHRISHPEMLAHPLIQKYVNKNDSLTVLSAWIQSQLPRIQFVT